MPGSSKEKKLIWVRSDLVSRLKEQANHQGKTFPTFITEILERAVRAYEMKHSLNEIMDNYELLEIHREAGATFTPREVWDHLVNRVCREDSRTVQGLWYKSGRAYGVYLRQRFDHPLDTLTRLLKKGRWDLNKVEVKNDTETVEFEAFSTLLSEEETAHLRAFIEGVIHSLGYKTERKECFRGIIRLKFSPYSGLSECLRTGVKMKANAVSEKASLSRNNS